ncbi:hypothetical protein BDN72DRAFT_955997 [Pluteus cervinus]|uniref:Uncharacterized protein n=1 Tax=Pluteus cervinus TaxID=181527 RepID=A0ACD3B7Z8_9AGAR|nr:hypothetical protein BDN72DRAFT_955997 [Pluteus cervinus]
MSSSTPNPTAAGLVYTETYHGDNPLGNHYCNFVDSNNQTGYQYHNADGTFFFCDTDGTRYYNDGLGVARLSFPPPNPNATSGMELMISNSRFTNADFNVTAFRFDAFRSEFPEYQSDFVMDDEDDEEETLSDMLLDLTLSHVDVVTGETREVELT